MRGQRVLLQKRAPGAPEGNKNYYANIRLAEKISVLSFFIALYGASVDRLWQGKNRYLQKFT
jgi:hypothetical protein